jgi:single-stranded-DNA-specific exonuclease
MFWKLPTKLPAGMLEKFPELPPVVVQLMVNRGLLTQEQIDEFLYPDYGQDVHDPFLFQDMEKVCQRLYRAIKEQTLITIFGDYDADGVTATVILKTVLDSLGAKVGVYLPHREKEGYGLNKPAIEELAKNGTKLIVTCDCGITNVEEITLANKLGLEVIITDHHEVPDKLPAALGIIHPQAKGEKYPFKFLAGGGVAFKLAQALIKHKDNEVSAKHKEIQEKWLLDMVAIAIVADMVPLLGENRTLLKHGLLVLKKSKRVGLQKMMEIAGLDLEKIDARSIAFSIAPRINAAGRMDHANLAYYLLTETDLDKAQQLANHLNQSNLDRQKLTEQIVKEAKATKPDLKDSLLIFSKPTWSAGLSGLVASRLAKDYARPCLVMTEVDNNIVGSGRSIEEFDITKALDNFKEYLIRYGGHSQAAGFMISKEKLADFIVKIKDYARQKLKGIIFQAKLKIELVVDFEKISWDLVDILDKFEPYGVGNPEPLFMSEEVLVTEARKVGQEAKHWKLELVKGNKKLGAIAFGFGHLDLAIGDRVDVVYNLIINEWNNNREIQLVIRDFKRHV